MRCRVEEVSPLPESLFDEGVLAVVELEDGLFEVSDTSVDKLGTLAAGTTAEVIAFDHCNLETACNGVEGNAGASRTATDDEKIIGLIAFGLLDVLAHVKETLESACHIVDGSALPQVRNLLFTGLDLGEVGGLELTAGVGRRRDGSGL